MYRLFVAIEPPEPVRGALLAAMGGVHGARWQSDAQLHLTLRFIGEVGRRQAEDIALALGSLRHPGFEIAVAGAGVFDRRGAPTTLWAGLTPQEPLQTLRKKVDRLLETAGVPPEGRAYQPHVTLARLNRASGPLDGFLAAHGGLASPRFRIDEICLYESELMSDGAVYTIVERYRLG